MSKFIVVEANDASFLLKEAHQFLGLNDLESVKQYDVFEVSLVDELDAILPLFDQGVIVDDLSDYETATSFRYRQILGQYDEVQEMTNHIVNNLRGHDLALYHSRIVDLVGLKDAAAVDRFKAYFINKTEAEVVGFGHLDYDMGISPATDLQTVVGFNGLDEAGLVALIADYSMDLADIKVVQDYFKAEGVEPTVFQLKVIDTYWSDHCRHTTFMTELSEITVADGAYQAAIEATIAEYNQVRASVYADRAQPKAVTLMDLATINAKDAKKLGILTNVDESDEVNACCIRIKVDVEGDEEDYLLYFKNETHNHPTEIEPFGGAATCIGGGIRDPLSGRSYVHQAMRITGAKSPLMAYDDTRSGKLPQRVITQKAAQGYSDYGNQIGQTAGYVHEYYHDGFEAKRMELGALVAAAPVDYVIRIKPEAGDKVILLGGRTGRDGLGAAVGSSMVQTEKSLALQGAEVQKGNPTIERKIIRLFRQPDATRLIKKCNDFGAGGVAVAIGELADGLIIDLDKVPTKYPGMDPSEIALSESQERMAVVVSAEDVASFVALAQAEDLEASVVATVTDSPYMVMRYEGQEVLRLKRDFIDSNGGAKTAVAEIHAEAITGFFKDDRSILEQLADVNNASQAALAQNFDFTIGKGTVLAPLGGKNQITPQEGMVAKIPVLGKDTDTASVMTVSFKPELATVSPYHGAYYAVVNSIAKAVALGVPYQDLRLTFQEFFERMENAVNWGKPTAALLGAFKAMKQLDLAAIGGKDSMSGTFEDLQVPPSLVSFAVAATDARKVVSRELKATDSQLWVLKAEMNAADIIETEDLIALFETVHTLINQGLVRAISTFDDKTLEVNLVEMALGNGIGFHIDGRYLNQKVGLGFILEVADDLALVEGAVSVGHTQAEAEAVLDGATYSLVDLAAAYGAPLAEVFTEVVLVDREAPKAALEVPVFVSQAKVLIPVMTGVNGEYDLYESFKRYTDHVDFFVVKEELDYAASVKELASVMHNYDVLAFPDGSILSNRLAYGQAMALLIEDLGDDLMVFLQTKYLLAVGASFAGFVRSGLMEFGRVQAGTTISFKANPYEKFVSTVVEANVVRESAFASVGSYSTALAGYELIVDLDEATFEDQILSKYTRFFDGAVGVDAMVDPSGHILGVNANFERFNRDGFNNLDVHEAPFIGNLLKVVGK
ncbi:phosphoribosylformylglycinamidine synthase [Fundicoccus culcitae]|uniref:Phosphoribosylformylglycinamidine synthase n=1 Tax=Fundicoccus culcitae TaxID=2969821 RepID=A0ABY5P8U9_9LACT|nr:phosphoribosylformylglycinamidine synthase [Fundicoccus culcitae]UUX35020.1 phosphoribosylformylglycinamidine synthase [Fundicoccus culcitae]